MPKSKKSKRNQKSVNTLTLLNIKVTSKDRRALNAAANKYADGNLSAWLRFAGMHFHPKKAVVAA